MFDDDLEDELEQKHRQLQARLREKARKEFIEGCYSAYGILERDGERALQQGDLGSICRAINRMMSLFLVREEYERCLFLKRYVEQHIPGHAIEPDPLVDHQLKEV